MDNQDKKAFTDEAMQLSETISYLNRYKQELLKLAVASGVTVFTWKDKLYELRDKHGAPSIQASSSPHPTVEDILSCCNRLSEVLTNPNGFPGWSLSRDHAAHELYAMLKTKLNKD